MWQYTDHEGELWSVVDKFDGQTRTSTETNTVTNDTRIIKETWSNDGSYSFEMTETTASTGAVFKESRSGTPTFADGKYKEVETVTITQTANDVTSTIESYTQTLVFNQDYSSTRTLEGEINIIGEVYTTTGNGVVITQDANWLATAVTGTATNSAGQAVTIDMNGTQPWGDPKMRVTNDDTGVVSNDERTVIGNKDATNLNDPVADNESVTIAENQAVIIDVLDGDTDADGDTLSIKSISDASYGQVNLANGTLIYTPNYGYSSDVEVSAGSFVSGTEYTITSAGTTDYTAIGATANTVDTVFTATGAGSGSGKATKIVPDTFTYTVTDGKGGTDQGNVAITVTGVNTPAVAVDDSFTFLQGAGSVVLDVLANDTDANGDDLSILNIVPNIPTATPNGGMFSLFGGVISYALPSATFTGTETVTYYVTDGSKDNNIPVYDTGVATVTIEAINKTPVAVADTATLKEDVDSVQIDVLKNDTDADGDTLTIDSFTNPSDGSARIMGGALFYTPDENFSGTDSLTYTITDPSGASATQTVTLTITGTNDAPVTVTDVLNVEEGSATGITIDLLSNDYDRESDAFTLTSVSTASHGTVVKNNNGTVTYTPGKKDDGTTNYTGADEFTYVTTDANGAKATGNVSVTVSVINNDPVAVTDASTVAEDSSSNRISVLTNDTDPEDNTLSLDTLSTPSHGTVTAAGNVVLYTPTANYSGSDSFNYWVTDGADGSAKGTVNITITSSNDAPTAVNDTLGTISGTRPTTVDLLLNDIDVDGDNLTISAVEGNIDISAGSFVTGTAYTIASVGTTDYTAIGASANTVDTVFTATGAGSGTGTATWDGDATHGNVTISGSSVRFNAARGKSGETDSFSYTITDPDGETSTAIANFTIADNTNPNSINDKATYLEDADAAQIDVTANDTDSDGDSVTVLQINTEPEYGTASVSNGKVFYVPDANYNGADSFTYIAKDGKGGRDEATVAITVTAVNDAPTTVSDTVSVETGSSANVISVLDNDSDADGQTISISSITDALHGTATLTGGILTYTPEATYAGPDSFSYKASDGTAETTGTVNITVSAGNNLPDVDDDAPAAIAEDSKNNEVDVLANDTDADSDTLSVASVTQGENGTVKLTSGTVFYTPDANFAGTDIFTYTAADGNGGISSGRVTMTVTGSPDDPTATNDTLADVEAGSGKIEVDLISNDIDVDGETISITAVSDALYGTTTYTAGKIYYQPSSTVETDAFTYTLTDAGGETATGSVKVDVVTANSTPTGAVTITGGTQPYQTLTVSNTMADADGIADITVSAGSFVTGTAYTIASVGDTDYTLIGASANTVDTVFTATGAGSGTGTGTANGTDYFSYQWYADGTAISGETATTYTVSLEDVGNKYSVKASYTDDRGNAESKTSDATDAVTALDQPFSFVASEIASDGTLTLTLKADVEAIYSRSDVSVLTGADLSLNIDWTKFDLLEVGGTTKYSIAKLDSTIVAMDSSSTSATDSFDTLTLASLRLTPPLLTIVDTDTTTTGVGTTGNLLTVTLKPSDATEKVAVSLSGTIEANQGQVTFNQYDATTSNITGVTTNSEPGGSVTISGTVAVDEILTASHSLTDADGMRVVSYQWLRDGVAITNATDSTYTITTTDVNKALSVKASYTDGAGTAETKTSSSSTVTQTTANKPFMISSELITAEAASIALYGADYSLDADETIIKLTLNGDITRFDATNALLYTSVAGAELDFSLDWTKFEDFEYNDNTTSTFEINKDYTGKLFLGSVTNDDGEFSKIVFSSLNTSAKPVLTLVDNVTSTAIGETDRPTTVDIATIYLNPIDSADDVEITYGGIVSANQGDKSFTQLTHSLEVEASTYDAIISTAATSTTITKLTGTSVNLWKDGTATSTSVAVDGGEISIDNTVAFDAVKLAATDAYDFDINISDAIDVLRHIVDLEALTAGSTAYHAADVDNDGDIDISDAIDVLRHIVDLEAIDTFDVIDSAGARVTQLDANATGEAPTWTLVANGDVDMSGSYAETYVTTVDIA
jgi:VCBS repeat-containing protein